MGVLNLGTLPLRVSLGQSRSPAQSPSIPVPVNCITLHHKQSACLTIAPGLLSWLPLPPPVNVSTLSCCMILLLLLLSVVILLLQVKELRDDLEEALGFMAPFLSPTASSLTSPGATPFVSPHRRPPAPAALQGRLAVLSPSQARPDASPFSVPLGTTYSLNPMHGVSGYSVTIGIGSPMPGRLSPCQGLPTAGLSLQQQQIGVPVAAASAASSRRVSLQDSAGGTPAAYLPLSAGLWRPEPHQLATPAHAAGAAAAPGHDPAQAEAAGASAGTTPAAAGGGRGSAARCGEQLTPGGSGSRLTRCASLDSPSFRAAALAGVGYDPTPPSQPSTGSRPFRGQLSATAGAAGGVAGQPPGLYVTPARAGGSATRAGGSSAGRLVRALSLPDSPSFIAAATAGMAYDITPVTSAGGVQAGDPSSHSRFAVSINASDAALRLFDALSDAADTAGPPPGLDVQPQQQPQQQQPLQLPVKDDSPEHHGLRRLPGGVAASAAAAAAAAAVLRSGGLGPRMSASTAEGAGSLRSSAVWSGRDSAVFDNSLYNTPRKRRKAKGPAAASSLAAGAGGGAAAAGGGGGGGCASDSGSQSDGSHSGLVSLTDSLTALQLRRMQLQQQGGAATGQGAAAAGFADSPPVTPTGGVAALDGSSPATTGTPVSVYRNIMFEESEAHIPSAPFQGCAEAPRAPRFVHDGAASTAAAADSAVLGDKCVTPAPAAPPPAAASTSAEDVAAAAMAAGRSYSPAEAVATVRSLAASATPPSLGSWREKRQQQQQQRQSSTEGNVALLQDQQQQGAAGAVAPPSSCDFAAGTATADSPVLLPRCGTNTQQETPCMPSAHAPGRRGVSPVLSALLSEVDSSDDPDEEPGPHEQQQQQPAVLSAELLQQHTLQQQQRYSALQLPWLQQQQVPPGGAASTPAGHAPLEQPVPGLTAAAAAGEGVLSPMLSELMSLGADVIDLAGSEADSDLLAVTPDRTCSRPGAAAQAFEHAAAEYEGLNRQLVFEEEGDAHGGEAQQGAVHTASTPQQDLQPAAADDSEQQQQHSAMGRAGSISLTGMKLEAAIAAASAPGQGSPDSAAAADRDDAEAPVLRLRGGAGYEPADDDDGADWLLDADESFDLADYGSSDDSDGPSEDPWELIPPGGAAAAPETSESSLQHSGTSAPANAAAAAAAAAGSTSGKLAGTSPGQKAARQAATPPGWLRPLPVGWGIGSAPDNAFRVALRTSGKPGSGTKTRVRCVTPTYCM